MASRKAVALSPRIRAGAFASASRAIKAVSWIKRSVYWPARFFFPPAKAVKWEKGHQRLEARQIARVAVTPEEIGLTGCWQVIAVQRQRVPLGAKAAPASEEIGYYATSLPYQDDPDEALFQIIRDHLAAIENGTHNRRDNTFAEDACQAAERASVQNLVTLRNLALGRYELQLERGQTTVKEFKSWCRRMTGPTALKLLLRTCNPPQPQGEHCGQPALRPAASRPSPAADPPTSPDGAGNPGQNHCRHAA